MRSCYCALVRSRILLQLDFHMRRIPHGILPTTLRRPIRVRFFFTFQYRTVCVLREEPAETEIDRNTCITASRRYWVCWKCADAAVVSASRSRQFLIK